MTDAWYLVRTKVQHEAMAEHHLERQDYKTYCPRLISKKRLFGRRIEMVGPLFPQYLFVNLLIGEQDLAPVKSTKGVLNIVRFGEDYALVPRAIITQLKRMEDPRIQLRVGSEKRFIQQSSVRVTRGPLFGLEGTFLKQCGEDRVTILLNLLGHQTEVSLPEGIVEACA